MKQAHNKWITTIILLYQFLLKDLSSCKFLCDKCEACLLPDVHFAQPGIQRVTQTQPTGLFPDWIISVCHLYAHFRARQWR